MAEACNAHPELCQLHAASQQSPQQGELMLMFEGLISNIFSHTLQNQTNESEQEAVPQEEPTVDDDAIDAKIKNALQLMKTNLSFAIREEVNLLKEKVVDLEVKIVELKTENRLLREYAPEDVLRQLEECGTPSIRSPMTDQSSCWCEKV